MFQGLHPGCWAKEVEENNKNKAGAGVGHG